VKLKHTLIVLITIMLLLIPFLLLLKDPDSIKNDIESGELQYTSNCGWINWGHALPEGLGSLIKEVVNDTSNTSNKKTITYGQYMKIKFIGNSKIVVGISRKYAVSGKHPKAKREEIAYAIFQETSEAFEKMQETFLYGMQQGVQNSSFKDGDLTGNNIAFYRALKGYDKDYIEKISEPVSMAQSLKLLEKGKCKKNTQWSPHYWLEGGKYPAELNEIKPDSLFLKKELKLLEESPVAYIDF
jgi:hypothetical protein